MDASTFRWALLAALLGGAVLLTQRAQEPGDDRTVRAPARTDSGGAQLSPRPNGARSAAEPPAERFEPGYYEGFLRTPYTLPGLHGGAPDFSDDPARFLERHLERAERGDPGSMVQVHLTETFCGRPPAGASAAAHAAASAENWSRLYAMGSINGEIHDEMVQKLKLCQSLWPILRDTHADWWSEARAAGSPIVRFRDLLRRHELEQDVSREELFSALGAAVATGDPFAMSFPASAVIDERRDDDARTIVLAWQYLQCQYRLHCDQDRFEANLRLEYFGYEVDEILTEAGALSALIDSGQIVHHDFSRRAAPDSFDTNSPPATERR